MRGCAGGAGGDIMRIIKGIGYMLVALVVIPFLPILFFILVIGTAIAAAIELGEEIVESLRGDRI